MYYSFKTFVEKFRSNKLKETQTALSILQSLQDGTAVMDSDGLYIRNKHGYFKIFVTRLDGRSIRSKFTSMESQSNGQDE